MKKYLEIGKITGTKGLRGEVVTEPWCDSPEFLKSFKTLYLNEGKKAMSVASSRIHKSSVVIRFKDYQDIEQAKSLIGEILYMDRNDANLEDNQYFVQDLIGLEVFDEETRKSYGKLTDVFKTGANDVYQVTGENGKNYLIPVIPDVVKKVDIEASEVLIKPIKGIFDDED